MVDKIDLNELQEIGLQAMKDFWGLENGTIENLNSNQVKILIQKSRLGIQFYREMNVHNRSKEKNTLRICSLLASDKKELMKMLKQSLPQYIPKDK